MSTQPTGGGSTTSFNNTPQARDDFFKAFEDGVYCFDVMLNDLGGAAKTLWSIDTTSDDGSLDLLAKDVAGVVDLSEMGAKISITLDGKISYDTRSSTKLAALAAGETAVDQFTYAIRLANGTLSWATVNITVTGTNDAPVLTIADRSGTVVEDQNAVSGLLTDSAALTFSDVDMTDVVTVSSVYNGDAVWSGGPLNAQQIAAITTGFTVDSNSWDYAVLNADVQFLGAGETITLSFTVTATDDSGASNNSDSEVITITITGTNDAPVLTVDTSGALAEDVDVAGSLLSDSGALSFTDVDSNDGHIVASTSTGVIWSGGDLSSAQISALIAGFTVDSDSWDYSIANSAVQFLDDGETVTLTFNVTVTDDSGAANNSYTEVVTITISGSNDAPSLTSDAAVLPAGTEDISYTVTQAQLLAGWSDVDGEPLSVTGLTATNASVSIDADGNYIIVPAANYNGPVQLSYSVTDGSAPVAASLSFTVTEVNDAPVAVADTLANVAEDSAARTITFAELLGNDSTGPANESGQLLTITAVDNAVGGTVAIVDGAVVFTPALNFNGTASFDYTVRDNGTTNGALDARTDKGSVSFGVTSVNDAPTGTDTTVTTLEDTAKILSAADFGFGDASDSPANGLLAVKITTLPASGALTLNGVAVNAGDLVSAADIAADKLVYTPALNAIADATFTFQVQDDGGVANGGVDLDASPNTLTIDITPVNDAPEAIGDSYSVAEDAVLEIAAPGVLANDGDVDGDTLSAMLVAGPVHGTLTLNPNGSFSYVPAPNYFGPDSFTYRPNDGTADGNVVTVDLTVTPVNDAPQATNLDAAQSYTEDTLLDLTDIVGSDIDSASLTVTLTLSNPAAGMLSVGTSGSAEATYDATTGVWTASGATADVNALLAGVVFSPVLNFNGDLTIATIVSDGIAPAVTGTKVLTGIAVNDAPVTAPVTLEAIAEDSGVRVITQAQLLGNATDVDNTLLTVTDLEISGGGGELSDNGDGTWNYTPASNDDTSVSFSYVVTDGALTANGSATLDITPVNDAPVAVADSYSTAEDTALIIAAPGVVGNDTDVEGEALSAILVTGPAHGGLSLNADGSFTYAPTSNYNGADSFTYRANDGSANSAPVTVSLTVTTVNDAPVVSVMIPDQAFDEDTEFNFTVPAGTFTDVDGDPLTYTATLADGTALPAWLTFDGSTGTFQGTPPVNLNAHYQVEVTASDGTATASDIFKLTITPVDDAPVLVTAIADQSSLEDNVWSFNLPAGTFADVDSAYNLTYSATLADGSPLPEWIVFNPTNKSFLGVPPQDFTGEIELKVTATSFGKSASDVFTLTVTPVNDAPAGTDKTIGTNQDVAKTLAAADFGFSDLEGNNFAGVTISTLPTSGTLRINGEAVVAGQSIAIADILAGDLVFIPAPGSSGNVTFTFQVQDDGGTLDGGQDLDQSANTLTIAVDKAPAVVVTVASEPLTDASPSTLVTFQFDEDIDMASFDASDIDYDAAKGTIGGFAMVDAITWTATYTALNGYDGSDTIAVGAGSYGDAAGNLGAGGSDTVAIDRFEAPVTVVANIKFVPNGSDFNTALPTSGEQIGSFVAYDAAGNVIPGATFAVTAGSSGSLTVANSGLVSGGLGNGDIFSFSITSGSATETVSVQVGNGSNNVITGSASIDILFGVNNSDTLNGGGNDDTLYGNDVADTLNGGENDDFLLGGNNDDTLNGGNGNDYLRGGVGLDILNGGSGNDMFVFNVPLIVGNRDTIQDFAAGGNNANPGDKIVLEDTVFTSFAAGAAVNFVSNGTGTASGSGAQVIFHTGTGGLFYDADGAGGTAAAQFATLTLAGITGTLDASDFVVV